MLGAVEVFVGEKIAAPGLPEPPDEFLVGLDGAERRGEVLERGDERARAAAVRRAEENVEVGAGALDELSVGPGVGGAAAMKIDVRRDDRSGRRAPAVRPRLARAARGLKMAEELRLQLLRRVAVNPADVRRRAHRLPLKIVHHRPPAVEEAPVVQIELLVKRVDHLLYLFARENLPDLLGIGRLNIDDGMVAVEMAQDEIAERRHDQRLGEMLGVAEADERLALLLDGKGLDVAEPRAVFHLFR